MRPFSKLWPRPAWNFALLISRTSEFEYWNITYNMPPDCTGDVQPSIKIEIESAL